MAYRNLAKTSQYLRGPTAPSKRYYAGEDLKKLDNRLGRKDSLNHPLTDTSSNDYLQRYENDVKGNFDRIVPLLKKISELQHEQGFLEKAQNLSISELGFELPAHILEQAWVRPLDMRALFAWCVFQSHKTSSDWFFESDPLCGSKESDQAKSFQSLLLECGFHLLDVTPCSDGRLAHTIAYVLRIPFSTVRRRSHAGALFDIERNVNRWVKTEHLRYLESMPNSSHTPTRYLKVVTYHFSSIDPANQGCAAHGSDDSVAASEGLQRLFDFREAIENSFCCGSSVDLLLIGIDTDTDAIRVHVPDLNSNMDLENSVSALDLYHATKNMSPEKAIQKISNAIEINSPSTADPGMVSFITRIIKNNFSQIDYVLKIHNGPYPDAGHAERFIGVGIGFKEVHLRNLTYFAHLDTVEEGAADLDVGIKIFKGLNVSRGLPIPIVVRFDYSGRVPGARMRAIEDCRRVNEAISSRYRTLVADGLLHTFLTIRDRDKKTPSETIGSSLDPSFKEAH
tara:strand:- start:477 stop:2006 length:1530 start_codon:yes stop_codon:yes gene_type:complete